MPDRLPFRSVTSRQNPIVAAFRDAAAHPTDELALIEGPRLALEAARAGWTLTMVAISAGTRGTAATAALLDELPDDTDRISASDSVLSAISPAASPSGLVALARRSSTQPDPCGGDSPLVLVADGVQDPGNVGAIARSAEAAGASGLLLCGASAHPFGWKALRGSMGSAFRLPIARYDEVTDAVRAVRAKRLKVLALAPRHAASVYEADLRSPTALVVGGEGAGLPSDVLALADATVSIPMTPPVESLNVAVAVAVALFEGARQRGKACSG